MKGFVTIATGDDKYYKMAVNLLLSYRYFTKDPYPFAIISDRENEFTRLFDKVVILPTPHRSFMDKINLLSYAPFDESIFIDADCLAYRDLNQYWSLFHDCSAFSAFGSICSIHEQNPFYDYEGTGVLKDRISYLTHLHGGVYYIRKGEACMQLLSTCQYIINHYNEFDFKLFPDAPADETVFALAMSVEGMKPVHAPPEMMCFYPCNSYFKSDISKGFAEFSMPWFPEHTIVRDCYCVHWGSFTIPKPVYQLEAYRLNKMLHKERISPLMIVIKKVSLPLSDLWGRVKKKLKSFG